MYKCVALPSFSVSRHLCPLRSHRLPGLDLGLGPIHASQSAKHVLRRFPQRTLVPSSPIFHRLLFAPIGETAQGGEGRQADGRNSRAVRLERAPRLRVVGDGAGLLEGAVAKLHECVLRRRRVDRVADPGVPARVDLGGVVVVLGVLDPAGAQGQLLAVLEEAVARAVGADEAAVLCVTCARSHVVSQAVSEVGSVREVRRDEVRGGEGALVLCLF